MTTVYWLFVWDSLGELAPELSETLTQFQNLPPTNLQPSLSLGSNTKEKLGETARRNAQNPRTRTHTSFILA